MKIAFVGKGGSGKTTLAALFLRHLAAERPAPALLALDADINQHLAVALGATDAQAAALPTLGEHLPRIKDYLRGDNPRILSADDMVKTTPPGRGSRLLRIDEDSPLHRDFVRPVDGVPLAVAGAFAADDLGVACYHSKVGAVELMLNHMVDGGDEYAVVDMTAGADAFASGLFTRFDVTFLVCEPTVRSVGVYRQYLGYARDFGVRVAVVGNKVSDGEDLDFLRDEVGDDLLTWVGRSAHVRAAERGEVRPIELLEPENRAALRAMRALVDGVEKDWPTYQRQAVEFHVRNARAWAHRSGRDLTEQVDPEFVPGPVAMSR
ncbi:CO dehydrogenase accessory protein CooC (nickel insertion) [Alloactinosynnema sp. L-07]|uniref:ATP-binding protein n=1 Tax=Alloactinosynnema sp. L-07 TaxID=1653480 RepID=UPI00065EFC6D|nr:ATP-binding protein [Alloactinosynnema sp. L-07]CRK61557.1 CO dehydrogenase accessory protein CooC (nickel insertion) [Alloactinosynnema sp. L-07]